MNPAIVARSRRLQKRGETAFDRPAPLLVILKDDGMRNKVLEAAKKLRQKNAPLNRVFINKDMSEAERKMESELRVQQKKLNEGRPDDAGFYYGIRGTRVIKINNERPTQPEQLPQGKDRDSQQQQHYNRDGARQQRGGHGGAQQQRGEHGGAHIQ